MRKRDAVSHSGVLGNRQTPVNRRCRKATLRARSRIARWLGFETAHSGRRRAARSAQSSAAPWSSNFGFCPQLPDRSGIIKPHWYHLRDGIKLGKRCPKAESRSQVQLVVTKRRRYRTPVTLRFALDLRRAPGASAPRRRAKPNHACRPGSSAALRQGARSSRPRSWCASSSPVDL